MNKLEYRIVEAAEAEKLYPAITDGLNDYSGEFNVPDPEAVHLYCYDDQVLIGAAVGKIVAPHLSVKWLWVEKAHRGNRIGSALMDGIEKLATDKGCDRAFVDTMSYQAPGFYTKLGYKEIARIGDFFPGFDRVFYRKELA